MLKLQYSSQFKKDYKIMQKRGYDINLLKKVIDLIVREEKLPLRYKEHRLIGEYKRI